MTPTEYEEMMKRMKDAFEILQLSIEDIQRNNGHDLRGLDTALPDIPRQIADDVEHILDPKNHTDEKYPKL